MLDIELKTVSLGDGEDGSGAWIALREEEASAK